MMKNLKYFILPIATGLVLSSCGGDDNKEEIENTVDSTKTEHVETNNPVSETFFQVPSPGEMLTFIKMVGGKTNKNTTFLSSPDNQKNYTDEVKLRNHEKDKQIVKNLRAFILAKSNRECSKSNRWNRN